MVAKLHTTVQKPKYNFKQKIVPFLPEKFLHFCTFDLENPPIIFPRYPINIKNIITIGIGCKYIFVQNSSFCQSFCQKKS